MSVDKVLEKIGQNPKLISLAGDHLDAAGLGKLVIMRRQRVHAAQRKLDRAEKTGASAEEITRIKQRIEIRKAAELSSQKSFRKANVRRPAPNPSQGQVFIFVQDYDPKNNLIAAVMEEDKVVVQSEITNEGFALLATDKKLSNLRLQVSGKTSVVFRDKEAFDLTRGDIVYKNVSLEVPEVQKEPPANKIIMPDLTGQSRKIAKVLVERLGIDKIKFIEIDNVAPDGIVIRQVPAAGKELAKNDSVEIFISKETNDNTNTDTRTDTRPDPNDNTNNRRFLAAFFKRVVSDERWSALSLANQPVEKVFETGEVNDRKSINAVIKLENNDIRDRFKLASLSEAVTLRSIMKRAVEDD